MLHFISTSKIIAMMSVLISFQLFWQGTFIHSYKLTIFVQYTAGTTRNSNLLECLRYFSWVLDKKSFQIYWFLTVTSGNGIMAYIEKFWVLNMFGMFENGSICDKEVLFSPSKSRESPANPFDHFFTVHRYEPIIAWKKPSNCRCLSLTLQGSWCWTGGSYTPRKNALS